MVDRDSTIAEARKLVGDLFRPHAMVYWGDFLTSLTVAYGCATVYLIGPQGTWLQLASFLMAGFALYRVASFMHEIVHFRKNELRGFATTWNLLAGIPMLTPSFFYESHIGHHNTHHYGTDRDGEYLPLGNGAWKDIAFFLSQVFVQPIAVSLRFLLTPISLLHPSLRRWALEHASSFVIDWRYRRPLPEKVPSSWTWIELGCSLRIWLMLIMVLVGVNPWFRIVQLYSLAAFILMLNHLRTLGAHRYLGDGEAMSHKKQLLDSTNVTGSWMTELLCPLGMRYHALHHLFPAMPYHNLGIAHRRLMAGLPSNSTYHQVEYPSYLAVFRELAWQIGRSKNKPENALPVPVSAVAQKPHAAPAKWSAFDRRSQRSPKIRQKNRAVGG